MSRPSPDPDTDFLAFARNQIKRMFRPGWDRSYERRVKNACISTSASFTSKLIDGGCRRPWVEEGRESYLSKALGVEPVIYDPKVRVSVVDDGGKPRVVTIAPHQRCILRPLHSMVYDHLSRKEWLLRGDAKPEKFPDFLAKDDEVFCSGDYESATDNLSLPVYQELLRCVLATSTEVPDSVKNLAIESSVSQLWDSTGQKLLGRQQRGQLMGNYLSFPFLCLTNFLVFKYFVRRRVPLRVNGDDIVFRARPDEVERWKKGVQVGGLKLSEGKTMVSRSVFSLNSTFFRATWKKVLAIPFVRSKAVWKRPDSFQGLAGQFGAVAPGFFGSLRREVQVFFLKYHANMIWRSGRSLSRGLGMRVSQMTLMKAGLWDRERFYLRLDSEKPLPPVPGPNEPGESFSWRTATAKSLFGFSVLPKDFARRLRRWSEVMREDRLLYDWSMPQYGELGNPYYRGSAYKKYFALVSQTGVHYSSLRCSKVFRLLHHSFDFMGPRARRAFNAWKSLKSCYESDLGTSPSEKFWVRRESPSWGRLSQDSCGEIDVTDFESEPGVSTKGSSPSASVLLWGCDDGSPPPSEGPPCPERTLQQWGGDLESDDSCTGQAKSVYIPCFDVDLDTDEEIADYERRGELECAMRVAANPALQARIAKLRLSL